MNRWLWPLLAALILTLTLVNHYGWSGLDFAPPVPPAFSPVDANEPRVSNPLPNQLVESPLIVRGAAPGNWFFEDNLPVRLVDDAGHPLAQIGAQAEGEWMTTDFVPFSAVLVFPPASSTTGVLIIAKDNPSGLPEHAAEFKIPVRFVNQEEPLIR